MIQTPPPAAGIRVRLSGGLGTNYWRLWTSSAASNLADGVFQVAFPLLAIQLTDSPLLVAGVIAVGRLPFLFFVLVAGALADRLDRRRTMVAVGALRAVVAGVLALGVVSGWISLPILYAAALVLGIGETLFDTAAQSIMPNVVDRTRLSLANGRLYAVELVMNQFVGPPLGGLLAGYGLALAFGGSSIAFVLAAIGLLLMVGSFRPVREGPPRSLIGDIRDGLDYLFGHRLLRTLAIMVGVQNLASTAVWAVFVLYAVAPGPMGLSEFGFGVLLTSLAVGSLIGTFVVERLERRFGRADLLFAAVVLGGATLLVPALTTNAWIVGAAYAVEGFMMVVWNVITVSLRQRIVPDALLGRLNASYRLLAWGTQPVGAVIGGIVGEVLGLRAVFVLAALAVFTLVFTRGIVTDAAIARAEAEGDAAHEAARAAVGPEAEVGASG